MTRLLALTPVLVLAACASTTEVQTRHTAESTTSAAGHILLAARSPESRKQTNWERHCKRVLKRSGLKITRGQKAVPGWQEPDAGALEAWAREHGADAVLLADITGLLIGPAHLPETDPATGEPEIQAQWTFHFGDDGPTAKQREREESVYQEIEVEWIAPDGKRFWTGVARTHEARELAAVARSQCTALGKTLAERGLIPAN